MVGSMSCTRINHDQDTAASHATTAAVSSRVTSRATWRSPVFRCTLIAPTWRTTNPVAAANAHAGLVDIALTRAPFDETGLVVRELRADPVGALLRADDPLARRECLRPADLADRRWFRFPDGTDGTDGLWQSYWNGGEAREGPVVRAVQECRQAVLWNGTVGMTLVGHGPGDGLTVVPVGDMPPSRVVVAWREGGTSPLLRSFVQTATHAYRSEGAGLGQAIR
jgi:DNA-binding transcriptional LysR family regulator